MVAYNFQKQFAGDVESGKKTQTIRKAGKRNPPKVGDELQLYTGMRTTTCRLLRRAKCISVKRIRLRLDSHIVMFEAPPAGRHTFPWNKIPDSLVEEMARADGFESVDAFFDFFKSAPSETHFSGFLIEWEPAK